MEKRGEALSDRVLTFRPSRTLRSVVPPLEAQGKQGRRMRGDSGLGVLSFALELLVTFHDLIVEKLYFQGEAGVIGVLQIAFEERVSLGLQLFAFGLPVYGCGQHMVEPLVTVCARLFEEDSGYRC